MQLLDYYGYLRKDGQQEHTYGFGVGLDSSESMFGWKKELLATKHLQDHQLYALKAMVGRARIEKSARHLSDTGAGAALQRTPLRAQGVLHDHLRVR